MAKYVAHPTKLWESDGTNDLTIGTSADIHFFNISSTSPGNDVTTTGAVNGTIPAASLTTVDTEKYDLGALVYSFQPTQGEVDVAGVFQSSPIAAYARGFAMKPTDEHLNVASPLTTDVTASASAPLFWGLLAAHTISNAGTPAHIVASGKPSGAGAAAHFATSGWLASTGVTINTTTNIFQSSWIGLTQTLVLSPPKLEFVAGAQLGVFWTPTFGQPIVTAVRIKGQIWFVGYERTRGF
jgi:hypothetical protein